MRRALRVLLVLAAAMAVFVGVLAMVPPEVVAGAAARTGEWAGALAVARVACIAALWWWWRPAVAKVPGLRAAGREYLAERRNFYCLALCAVELFVVQNVAGEAWRGLG